MAWFKVDDKLHTSRKLMSIPRKYRLAALGLWTIAGSWSADQLTDGCIPEYMVEEWGATKILVDWLLKAGLWEKVEEETRFKNWSEYQPTKADIEADREKNREKLRKWRERNRGTNEDVTGLQDGSQPVSNPAPDPTRPDPTHLKDADASFPAGNVSELRTTTSMPIPENFTMTAAMQNWALRTTGTTRTLDLELETEKFAAHAREKNITSASWPDSWRKWILKAMEFYDRDQAAAGGPGLTKEELKAKMTAPIMFRGKPLEEPA